MKQIHKPNLQGFTLIELMIVVSIIGILASIAIPSYRDYMTTAKWNKTISGIASLQLAIGECINDNNGLTTSCDVMGAPNTQNDGDLEPYGVSKVPSGVTVESTIVTLENNAVIRIIGTQELGLCQFDMTPTVIPPANTISWVAIATAGGGVSIQKCRTYIRGSS